MSSHEMAAMQILLVFAPVAGLSLVGLFASRKRLESMAGIIGTKNPLVARIVCGLGFLLGSGAVFLAMLRLLRQL
jgi:hypothetical protein